MYIFDQKNKLLKLLIETSTIFIGFILVFVSIFYQFSFGKPRGHFYFSSIPINLPMYYFLLIAILIYFSLIVFGMIFYLDKGLGIGVLKIFYIFWLIATFSLLLVIMEIILIT